MYHGGEVHTVRAEDEDANQPCAQTSLASSMLTVLWPYWWDLLTAACLCKRIEGAGQVLASGEPQLRSAVALRGCFRPGPEGGMEPRHPKRFSYAMADPRWSLDQIPYSLRL